MSALPFEPDQSEESRRDRLREATAKDFQLFSEIFFGGDPETDGTARNWLNKPDADFHRWSNAACQEMAFFHSRVIGITHRGGGKSTRFSVFLPIFCSCVESDFFLIISPVWRGFMGSIIAELEENRLLGSVWGDRLAPARDIKKQFKSYRDALLHLSGGAVIGATSPDGPIRGLMAKSGMRPRWIVVDDPQKDAEKINRDNTRAFTRKFNEAIIPALPPGGRGSIAVIDSYKGSESFSLKLFESKKDLKRWTTKLSRAFNPETGEPESFLSKKELDALREDIGDFAFDQEFGSKEGKKEGALFDLSQIAWAMAYAFVSQELPGGARKFSLHLDPEFYRTVFGADPIRLIDGKAIVGARRIVTAFDVAHGFSEEKTRLPSDGDHFAATTAALLDRPNARGLPVWAIPEAMTWKFGAVASSPDYDSKLEYIVRAALTRALFWGSQEFITESNGAQKFIAGTVRKVLTDLKGRIGIRFSPNAGNKEARIGRADGPLNGGRVIVTRAIGEEYAYQLGEFRMDGKAKHDDAPDSLEVALRNASGTGSIIAFGPNSIATLGYTSERGELVRTDT